MFYIRFLNQKTAVKAEVKIIAEGVVSIKPEKTIPDNLSGFWIYTDRQLTRPIGDYSGYKTRYKKTEKGVMYISTGQTYTEPAPVPEPKPEEIAQKERLEQIAALQEEIDGLKKQIDATDYKYTKSYEYSLEGKETGYDMAALHTERQAYRDRINELERVLAGWEGRA